MRPAAAVGRGRRRAGARRAARDHRRPRRRAVRRGPGAAARWASCSGAVLATSAVANGLFAGDPFAVGISGGFASPTAQRLLARGRRRRRLRRRAERVDDPPRRAVGRRDAHPGRPRRGGDRRAPAGRPRRRRRRPRDRRGADRGARRARAAPTLGGARRSVALAAEIAAGRWRDEPYEPSRDWLDPRTLSIALDELLPAERTVVGRLRRVHGLPVDVPARPGRARASSSRRRSSASGSALGNAIGAAVARPGPADRRRGRRRRAADGAARPGDARPR